MTPISNSLKTSNHIEMARAFEIFGTGMRSFVHNKMRSYLQKDSWVDQASAKLGRPIEYSATDPYFQLLVLRRFWGSVFQPVYSQDLRPIVESLITLRNDWAHFALPDEISLLDEAVLMMERLLAPVNPEAAVEVRYVRDSLATPNRETDPVATSAKAQLQTQLDETLRVVESLQTEQSSLEQALTESKRQAAEKQITLEQLESQNLTILRQSGELENALEEEKSVRTRLEWYMIAIMATVILILALVG